MDRLNERAERDRFRSRGIMQVAVEFQDERFDFEVEDDRLLGVWNGPPATREPELWEQFRRNLETPRDYPPLRQTVVPGDRVVIPLDPDIPNAHRLLAIIIEILQDSGVPAEKLHVVALEPPRDGGGPEPRPEGIHWTIHDPDNSEQLAYLASTQAGRRIYLNRALTDADVVLPLGRLGFDPVLGYLGPWSTIFPGLSDTESQRAYRGQTLENGPNREHLPAAFQEASEVSWLLGCQFHLGVVPGTSGVTQVLAGLESTVREEGIRTLDRTWTFRAEAQAELVIAGIGQPGLPTRLEDLAKGLATASRLVRRGGKIAILSRTEGPLGPALQRLVGLDDPQSAPRTLRGAEGEPDYPAARQLARALAWSDVYLLSELDADIVDDLSMIALARPEEARRLASLSASCLVLSQADRTKAEVAEEA